MEKEFAKADLEFRRKLFALYALGLSLLIFIPWKLGPLVISALRVSSISTILRVIEIGSLVFLCAFIFPSLFLIQQGKHTLREAQYPHSKMKVIYDTRIKHGQSAIKIGKRLKWLGYTCIVATSMGSVATYFLIYKFKYDPEFFLRW